MSVTKIAIPNKGRLSEGSINILKRAGLNIVSEDQRKLYATTIGGDFSVLFIRANDIPEFVQSGVADVGITGLDIVSEVKKDIEILLKLNFGKCALVIAAPEDSNMHSVKDVRDGMKVSTSFPNLTREYFGRLKKNVEIVQVSGATEVTPHIGVADLITDLSATGSTLMMNRLKKMDTILESTAVLIGNKQSIKGNQKIVGLVSAIESVMRAETKKYLMANVPVKALEELRTFLPGLAGPTVVNLMGTKDEVAVHVVVDNDKIDQSITKLKKLGATGILIVPVDRMVP